MTHHGGTSHEIYTAGFYANTRDATVRGVLGRAARGGSDVGEVLATIAGVDPDDDRGWFQAWLALGERVASIAETSAAEGHRVSAARAFLRAATYLAVAVEALQSTPDAPDLPAAFRAHRRAWERFADASPWPLERLDLRYDGGTLPGWFFRPDDSGLARPTLVCTLGSDEPVSALWCQAAAGALERGYNVLIYEGPGQQAQLIEHGVPFRPDWGAVLTPIVDVLLARDDVDAAGLAAYGISQAGYWVPRALAFEHRFAAAILDGGVTDVAASWRAHIPASLLARFDAGDTAAFERDMGIGMRLPGQAATRATWAFRARPYGTSGYADTLAAVAQYALGDLPERITTPVWIGEPELEQFWPGQSAALAARLRDATLVRFTADEGASFHCQPLARELTEQRMFDWLDDRLGR